MPSARFQQSLQVPFSLIQESLPPAGQARPEWSSSVMTRLSFLASSAVILALIAPSAAAQNYGYNGYNSGARNTVCERQKDGDKMAGAVVGALLGGLAGGALGNEIRDNNNDDNRGRYRGYRGHDRYGYYGRGRGHRDTGDGDGTVVVGALLGAVAGGVAGSALAEKSSPDCTVAGGYGYDSQSQGNIPRSTDGLYGGPEVMNGGRYPETRYPDTRYPEQGRSYPVASYPSYPEYEQECRTVYRETRLPDGRTDREPVTACRDDRGGWRVEGERTSRSDQELFGY
jgi:hypothetical protein